MNKKIILFAIICALIFDNTFAQTPVAVIDFEGEGISAMTLTAMSELFRSDLIQTGLFKVMDRNNMDEILNEHGFQLSGCTDQSCIVEVGQILGVKKMFGGTIGKLGKKYVVSVKFIDVETGEIEKIYTEKFLGAVEDLDQPITNIAAKLSGVNTQVAESASGDVIDYQPPKIQTPEEIVYEKEKRNPYVAMTLSILPGLGHIYSKNYGLALLNIGLRVIATEYTIGKGGLGGQLDNGIPYFLAIVIDISSAVYSTNKYNNKLKQKYNISMHPIIDGHGNGQVALTIDF